MSKTRRPNKPRRTAAPAVQAAARPARARLDATHASAGSRPAAPAAAPLRHHAEAPRLAGLDGLRGIAVLAVIAYHLGQNGLAPAGFLGVDMFFVISGFIITALLLREHGRSGRIDLRAFYLRRARRLLPPAFAMVAVVAVLALTPMVPALVGHPALAHDPQGGAAHGDRSAHRLARLPALRAHGLGLRLGRRHEQRAPGICARAAAFLFGERERGGACLRRARCGKRAR